jgi:hypothetical protein
MLMKENAVMRAREAPAAERQRKPWMVFERAYELEGREAKLRLLDLFEGRRRLIVYRAFLWPGVSGRPVHACRRCSPAPIRSPRRPTLATLLTTARRINFSGSACRGDGIVPLPAHRDLLRFGRFATFRTGPGHQVRDGRDAVGAFIARHCRRLVDRSIASMSHCISLYWLVWRRTLWILKQYIEQRDAPFNARQANALAGALGRR